MVTDSDDVEAVGSGRSLEKNPGLQLADVSANRCCHRCHGERRVHTLLLKALEDALGCHFSSVEEVRSGGGAAAHVSVMSIEIALRKRGRSRRRRSCAHMQKCHYKKRKIVG